jgi:limonene-1,2-epoxide hydrolase
VDGAGAALAGAAAVLGPDQAERIAQRPQQRGVGFDIDLLSLAVDVQRVFTHRLS